ncbi:hypothetical protein [Bordetella flabilis]|uniref:Uncharacterized protein n=1 Tax=Bordetella flabilis TaxID=463014 RepID=A0A193GBG4_9BORD|nr:hypothetical protein [Bordetella flabilis]ANN76801.1 hypothetical protein BAU07_06450 [Bordetella flabilis]
MAKLEFAGGTSYVSWARRTVSINEGGRFFTLYLDLRGMFRVWAGLQSPGHAFCLFWGEQGRQRAESPSTNPGSK